MGTVLGSILDPAADKALMSMLSKYLLSIIRTLFELFH